MNTNSVCYIETINKITPINGADNIELVTVGGWNAITQKEKFTVGDLVIIATTDAIIPIEIVNELGIANYLRNETRVRTIKLRGVYSECLIIPLNICDGKIKKQLPKLIAGIDCMKLLNIIKYEPPLRQIHLSNGKTFKYKDNENFKIYYKFPNIKNVSGMFDTEDTVQITRKLHGTNSRYGFIKKQKINLWDRIKGFILGNRWFEYEFIYGSHHVEKGSESQGFYSTDVWSNISDKFEIKNKLVSYIKNNTTPNMIGTGITIYGEIYGAGIQSNYDYGLNGIEFAGFDIKVNDEYQPTEYTKIIFDTLQLPHVDILYVGKWSQDIQDKFVYNNYIAGTKVPHEGIVIKNITGKRNSIAKVINPDYLIYSEKNNVSDSH